MLRTLRIWLAVTCVTVSVNALAAERPGTTTPYLEAVRKFGQALREQGRPLDDTPDGKRGMWPLVLSGNGARPKCNLIYESSSLRVLRVLAELSDEGRHRLAANRYVTDFLAHGQSAQTGLLAWGPTLGINVDDGSVVGNAETGWHQLVPRTTPWEVLWDSDPQATTRAITGLDYHFLAEGRSEFADRGPYFDTQRPRAVRGTCEQSGLLAHAYAFLHHKTGEEQWLSRARTCADFGWARHDGATRLVPEQLSPDAPSDASVRQVMYGYLLLKCWKEVPAVQEWGQRGVTLIVAFDEYAYDPIEKNWNARVTLDGKPLAGAEPGAKPAMLPVWNSQPDEIGVPELGRAAAYAAGTSSNREALDIARRAWDALERAPRPADGGCQSVAFALGLGLDLYDLTKDKKYLTGARNLADDVLKRYWTGQHFRDRPGSRVCDARLGAGDLAAALLRLHLRLHPFKPPRLYDWTF